MRNKKDWIFNVVIGVLSVALVCTVSMTVRSFCEMNREYHYEEEDFLYRLQDKKYPDMLRYTKNNEINGVKSTKTMEECYAVARYYEAAFYYKVYSAYEDEERAHQKAQIMEEQKLLMGEFSYAAEEICEMLGID